MKATWFQIHWAIGVSAGIVLAVVGVTGACLSFQNEILHALNPSVITVTQKAESLLTPVELLARIQAAHPEKRVVSLTVYRARDHAARVVFAAKPDGAGGLGARRSEVRYANPYTGELLREPRGAGFFRLVMETHRWLAAGAVGKHVVGACTIALVVMCLSGLYLRWQRRPLDWRAWLTFDWTRRGRGFLRDLHATMGTWVLIPYLVMGLTGLHWSYDWYRDALYALTGAPRPAPSGGTARAPSARHGGFRRAEREGGAGGRVQRAEAGSRRRVARVRAHRGPVRERNAACAGRTAATGAGHVSPRRFRARSRLRPRGARRTQRRGAEARALCGQERGARSS
jgi:sulfite reductase (NADPH) flavoprotein alpha-component